jgi:hypothetical protein
MHLKVEIFTLELKDCLGFYSLSYEINGSPDVPDQGQLDELTVLLKDFIV